MAVDDVIHQILPLLPTKSAVRMSCLSKQWQAVWFSLSILDFDEGDPAHDSDNKLEKLQHTNFINILDRYCRNAKNKKLLEKFRLRMTTFSIVRDSVVVNKCLSFAVGRSLKELDISLRPKHRPFLCCLSLQTLLDAKSLTTLSLEFVRIKVDDNTSYYLETLPSLKSLSLKSVQLISEALSLLVSGCPSIEYLSLCSCTF
ncbi:putative FBD-associated F-box protein At5g56690 [Rosa rugosa]|uniref:putative FBD-associated F-box protein At5g56690 n=1 Tax=Rosa rugosa TaxID=74645 RepID=UPI002B40F891|nr:putative FBD-associated F-box protein At5g56690 [Rosa rugosa]